MNRGGKELKGGRRVGTARTSSGKKAMQGVKKHENLPIHPGYSLFKAFGTMKYGGGWGWQRKKKNQQKREADEREIPKNASIKKKEQGNAGPRFSTLLEG